MNYAKDQKPKSSFVSVNTLIQPQKKDGLSLQPPLNEKPGAVQEASESSPPENLIMKAPRPMVAPVDSMPITDQSYQRPEENVQSKQGEREEDQEPELVQQKSFTAAAATGTAEDPGLDSKLNNLRGGGEPLPGKVQAQLEPTLGTDLGKVRVHRDEQSAALAGELGARAFTNREDIYFNRGEYNPDTRAGTHLLAHELAHVRQQQIVPGLQYRLQIPAERDRYEREADAAADGLVKGSEHNVPKPGHSSNQIQGIQGVLQMAEAEKVNPKDQKSALKVQLDEKDNDKLEDSDKDWLRNYYQSEFRFLIDFVPKEQYDAVVKRYADNYPIEQLKYDGGFMIGIIEGVFIGAKNTILAIIDLVKLIVNLEVEYLKFLGKTVPKIPSTLWESLDFIQSEVGQHLGDWDEAIKEDIAFMNNVGALAKEVGAFILSIPGIIPELFNEGKNLISGEISKILIEWVTEDAFNQGKDVGKLVGQIIFEVVIAVIGTKGADKVGKITASGKLGLILKNTKLEKVLQALEKLNAIKMKLILLLQGTKYDDVIKLFSERRSELVQKAVQEVFQEMAEKGLKEVSEELTERAIRKVAKESFAEIQKETGKKISKDFIEETSEKLLNEIKPEITDLSKQKLVGKIVDDKTGTIDNYFKSSKYLQDKAAAFSRYRGNKSYAEWEKMYDILTRNRLKGKIAEHTFQAIMKGEPLTIKFVMNGENKIRYVDNFYQGVLREMKSGPLESSDFVIEQIKKDIWIKQTKDFDVEWHLLKGGDSKLIQDMIRAGIKVIDYSSL